LSRELTTEVEATPLATHNWTITGIALHCGNDNIITVTARDVDNNTASTTLTVDVKPCNVAGFGVQ